jgi:hypothetical protein
MSMNLPMISMIPTNSVPISNNSHQSPLTSLFFQCLFQPIQGPGLLFSSVIIFTDGRTPWASDQLVARPLPKHRATQTQNKHIHTPNIHALSGFRATMPASERTKIVNALDSATTVTSHYLVIVFVNLLPVPIYSPRFLLSRHRLRR